LFVAVDLFVGGRHGVDRKAAARDLLTVVDRDEAFFRDAESVGGKGPIRRRHDDSQLRIDLQKRAERLGIQVVGVVVARGDHVDEVEPLRGHGSLGHPHVRFVGGGVLLGERI